MPFPLDPRLRALLFLWGAQLIVSATASGPLFLALGEMTDSDLSSPGGLMLLEMLRLRQSELLSAGKETLTLLALGHAVLLFFRAHLSLAIVQATGEVKSGSLSLRSALGYAGLWIVGALLRCLLLLGGAWLASRALDGFEGGLSPKGLARPTLYALATLLSVLCASVLTETAQLSLFVDDSVKAAAESRFACLRRLLAQRFLALLGVRIAQGLAHLALLVFSFYFFILPQGMAATHPLLCAVLNQIAVGATLGLEALWLHFVAIQFKRTARTGDASGASLKPERC